MGVGVPVGNAGSAVAGCFVMPIVTVLVGVPVAETGGSEGVVSRSFMEVAVTSGDGAGVGVVTMLVPVGTSVPLLVKVGLTVEVSDGVTLGDGVGVDEPPTFDGRITVGVSVTVGVPVIVVGGSVGV